MARKNSNIDIIDTHIGQKIYELRIARGLSRQELGNKIGVTHQQCQKYEKGTNRVSAGRLVLISKVLDKPIDYFYSDISDEEPSTEKISNQRLCIEVSRNFMKIKNSVYQDAVSTLIRTLAKDAS
ncbi:MAG: helix-turn-helix domain-containing protein [Alphaproteobacteria bacterium]|nr:helix-turn-helix domain-containing protein [Alphaproteobacteria bacterium]